MSITSRIIFISVIAFMSPDEGMPTVRAKYGARLDGNFEHHFKRFGIEY